MNSLVKQKQRALIRNADFLMKEKKKSEWSGDKMLEEAKAELLRLQNLRKAFG